VDSGALEIFSFVDEVFFEGTIDGGVETEVG